MSVQRFSSGTGDANGNTVTGAEYSQLLGPGGEPIAYRTGLAGATPGGLMVGGLNDDTWRPFRVDRGGAQAIARMRPMFSEQFDGGTVLNQLRWVQTATTFAPALDATGWRANSTNLNTANAGAMIVSNRKFARSMRGPLQLKMRAPLTNAANVTEQFGFGSPSAVNTVAVGPNSAFIRYTSGTLYGVLVTAAGSEQVTTTPTFGSATPAIVSGNSYTADVWLDDDEVRYIVQDTAGATLWEARIPIAAVNRRMWTTMKLPVFAQSYVGASVSASPSLFALTECWVGQADLDANDPAAVIAAANGLPGGIIPTSGAQSTTWANSGARTSATLSNTAAGYATPDGHYQFVAPAGAVTDYALFAYQVPDPYEMVITGIDISAVNDGAIVATTPTELEWFVAWNHTAVSLATATAARRPLGKQSFLVGAAAGASVPDLSRPLLLTVNPGRFICVGVRVPVGTATASQVISGMVHLSHYFQ